MQLSNLALLHKLQRLISASTYSRRLRLKSLGMCNTRPLYRFAGGGTAGVHVEVKTLETGEIHAKYIGLGQCENVWACPYCSARKIQEYRAKITKIIQHWAARGYVCHMITFTVPHYIFQGAAEVLDNIKDTYKVFLKNYLNRWRRDHGAPGTISAYECKYNYTHGWHFHLHVAVVMPESESATFTSAEFEADWQAKWRTLIQPLMKFQPNFSAHCGLKISKQKITNGDYIAKELAKSRSSRNKKVKTIDVFDLLESDDPRENELFLEFCEAIWRRSRITIGTKLLRSVDLSDIKKKVAETGVISTALVATFTYTDWTNILEAERDTGIPHRINILRAAEFAELDGILLYCYDHNLPLPHEPTVILKEATA